jgi:eukaryotic-like serine/threonine-protein kinase
VKKPTGFGKYFLLERINVGGMAEVFRAKAFGVEGFERLVAVKRILPNIAEDQEFIRMFIEEAKLAVQLNHANIAQIFDLGVVDGAYYIALEHVHGRDVRGIFDRCRQLGEVMPIAQACFVAMKICEGLDYAHNKRDQAGHELALVHRDVSPQNILISFEGEVKLIDFGIAKAADLGNATQSGILKGKFGYMSPEQVRGDAVDRRSDVFSCGIVLYELLTGERLFVGESDFSTLEKVRNVELLPPSTYNRKIPDELERIVLKALTKEPGDRYQNAIDLHDELQAFVYTAGEFYSRKDLAGWMKKAFTKEIEDETAKLESYRQLKAPVPVSVEVAAGSAAPRAVVSTASVPARKPTPPGSATKPPPPPMPSRSQPMPVIVVPPVASPAAPAAGAPAAVAATPVAAASPSAPTRRPQRATDSGWDDDEIETRIYDSEDEEPRPKVSGRHNLPLQPPVSSSPAISLAAADGPEAPTLPREGWEAMGHELRDLRTNGARVEPSGLADGAQRLRPRGESGPTSARRELSAPHRLVSPAAPAAAPPRDPMASFGARITGGRRPSSARGIPKVAIAVIATAAISVLAAIALSGSRSRSPAPAPSVAKQPAADPSTGFDLYVTPPGVPQWKLDGETRTDRLPSRIRGISPGAHTVQIDPPPGFLSQVQNIAVELGRAPKVEIILQPIPNLSGLFDSSPPGALVSLIVDGKRQAIGPSPARAPLDPRNTYQVLFELPGYVSVNRPIAFSGGPEERIVVNLERASAERPRPPVEPRLVRPPPAATPRARPPEVKKPARPTPPPDRPTAAADPEATPPDPVLDPAAPVDPKPSPDVPAGGQGVLVVGAKPPCEIIIDGRPTGLVTPQKDIKLAAGRHRVTLVNAELGIRETFSVDIKPDATEKVIKDFSDRIPSPPAN